MFMKYAQLISLIESHSFYVEVHREGSSHGATRFKITGIWRNPRGCFFVRVVNTSNEVDEEIYGQIDPKDDFFVQVVDDPHGRGLCGNQRSTPFIIKGLDLSQVED